MSVSTVSNKIQYTANDVTTVFAYDFLVLLESQLKVFLTDANGVDTQQTLTTHYTVSGIGDPAGGTITFVTAPASPNEVTIKRETTIDQLIDYVVNDRFPSETHEQALDKLTLIVQDLAEQFSRSLVFPETEKTPITNEILAKADRLGKTFRFNETTGELEFMVLLDQSEIAQAILDTAASAAAAGLSETNAAASAAAAGLSETNAAASAALAQTAKEEILSGAIGLVSGVDLQGVRSDGTQEALIFPVRDYPISNHSFALVIKRLVGTTLLLTNADLSGNLGEKFFINSDGTITIQFGNGTDFTTYAYTTTEVAPISVGAWGEIAIVLKRATLADIYVNGNLLESLDISGSSNQSLASGQTWKALSDGTTHYDGSLAEKVVFENSALTLQQITDRFYDRSLWLKPVGDLGVLALAYTLANINNPSGWDNNGGTISEQDAVADLDDWVKFIPDTDDSTHSIRWTSGLTQPVVSGDTYRVSGRYYSPSANGDNLNGFRLLTLSSANYTDQSEDLIINTKDAIVNFSFEFTATQATVDKIYLYPKLDGAHSYPGDGSSYVLFNELTVERLGTGEIFDLRAMGPQKPSVSSDAFAYFLPDGGVVDQELQYDEIRLTGEFSSDGWLVFDQTSDVLYEAGLYIDSVLLQESGGGVTLNVGSTLGGSEIVSAEILTSGETSFGTLVTQFPAARKIHINSGSWGSGVVNVTVTLKRK